jgi:ribosomal protein S18 acetylase RimI-like enzyme
MQPYRRRLARSDDYRLFVRLFGELGTGDPTPSPERFGEHIAPHTIFLEQGGNVVAYAWAVALGELARVINVVVDPACRSRGVGGALMDALASHLRERGCCRWSLNVKPENAPALRLYQGRGLSPVYRSASYRLPWEAARRLPSSDQALELHPVPPGDDAALEASFAIPGGLLAVHRAQPGRVLLQIAAPGEPAPLGIGSFDPGFPGVFPLRLARPSLARALLAGIAPYALPEHDYTLLLVEDDAELARAVVQAGAELRFELLHLVGAIPGAS